MRIYSAYANKFKRFYSGLCWRARYRVEERHCDKKHKKVYLPYQQMTSGFYEAKADDLKRIAEYLQVSPEDLEMTSESRENLRMAIRYDEIIKKPAFNKIKEGLMVTKAEDIKNFTKFFLFIYKMNFVSLKRK